MGETSQVSLGYGHVIAQSKLWHWNTISGPEGCKCLIKMLRVLAGLDAEVTLRAV